MATPPERAAATRNRLLAALPEPQLQRLLPALEPTELTWRQAFYEADAPIRFVHFLLTGVASLVTTMEDGAVVEVATVGNEGLVGLPVFLGTDISPLTAFVQVPGAAVRMRPEALEEEVRNGGALSEILRRYTQAFLVQLARSSACNRRHSIEERCARGLLMTHDRVGADEFPLTQEFLSQMLGVRRSAVSVAAGRLQKAGLISYRWGRITVLDRGGLENTACECYRIIRNEYERLLG
jgi:CRP-like cAMP-binding protein